MEPPDAEPGDTRPPPDARPEPYESLPPCDSAELWTLEPTREVRGPFGQCSLSRSHPLFRFERRASLVELEEHERTCWRVEESTDAGWTAGTIVETAPGEPWEGYVAGAEPEMIVDMRVVFDDGHLAAADDARFASRAGTVVPEALSDVRAVTAEGAYATADAVFGRYERWRFAATDPHGLVHADRATAWLERRADGVWLRYAHRVREGDTYAHATSERELEGDPSALFLAGGGSVVHAVVGSTYHRIYFSTPAFASPRLTFDEPRDFGTVPDEVTDGPVGLVARKGDAIHDPFREVADELGSGVSGFVRLVTERGGRQGVLLDGRIRAIEEDPEGRLVLADSPSIEVPEGVGRPWLVLLDGRIVGSEGTWGPPLPPGPDYVSSEVMYGGPVVGHAVWFGDDEVDGWLVADTPEGRRRIRIGEVHPDACGL